MCPFAAYLVTADLLYLKGTLGSSRFESNLIPSRLETTRCAIACPHLGVFHFHWCLAAVHSLLAGNLKGWQHKLRY